MYTFNLLLKSKLLKVINIIKIMKKILNKIIPLAFGTYINSLSLFSKTKAAKKAFILFCTPRKGKVLPHQKEYLDEAKKEIVQTKNVAIQTYEWKGSKETILLLHGWESNVFRWRNLVHLLQQENYNIIACDAPGHGNSSGAILNVPLYEECTHELIEKYQPTYIIGHSLGAMTALYNQYKRSSNTSIKKVITLGSPSVVSEFIDTYSRLLNLNKNVLQSLDDLFVQKFNFRIKDFSIAEYAKKIDKKGLLIHDELDPITPFKNSENIHRNWKNSKLIKTTGYGHSLHQEDVNASILAFLAT